MMVRRRWLRWAGLGTVVAVWVAVVGQPAAGTDAAAPDSVGAGAAVTLVSVSSTGRQGNGPSRNAVVSARGHGRYVAFISNSSNLVPGETGWPDVYVRDRVTGTTERVSVSSAGEEANYPSEDPDISATGRYVVFASSASNLVPGDTDRQPDIFVHDRETGRTTLVSLGSDGRHTDLYNFSPSISPGGRYVAFRTDVYLDSNNGRGVLDHAVVHTFLRDRVNGVTEHISTGLDGQQNSGDAAFSLADISAGGRFVAFESRSSNLVPRDTNGVADVFVRDRLRDVTERVSVSTDGEQADTSYHIYMNTAISRAGRFVAFSSDALNLVAGDTNGGPDVFVRDRLKDVTTRVSVGENGQQGNSSRGEIILGLDISAGGRFVVFDSQASNLVAGDRNRSSDVFLRDRRNQVTLPVSLGQAGEQANAYSYAPTISLRGRYVAFHSYATNLVDGDTNGEYDVFLWDRRAATTGLPTFDVMGSR